jgi:hypothetical protein
MNKKPMNPGMKALKKKNPEVAKKMGFKKGGPAKAKKMGGGMMYSKGGKVKK